MNRLRHVVLGAVFFSGLFVLGVLTIYLGNFEFGAAKRLEVYFEEVNGLRAGNPVLVSGVEVGRVRDIDFSGRPEPRERLVVTVSLEKEITMYADHRILISDQSLLGGRQLEIVTGGNGTLDRERPLYGEVAPSPFAALEAALGGIDGARLTAIFENLDDITGNVARGEKPLLEYLLSDTARADLDSTFANARSITDKIDSGEGSFSQLLNDDAVIEEIQGFASSGRDLFDQAVNGEGTLAKLFQDDSLYKRFEAVGASLEDIAARLQNGEGLLGKLASAESDALYEDIRSFVADASTLSADLADSKGILGRLIRDEDWASRLDTVLTDLEATGGEISTLIAEVREGRGVLGYLVADDDARREVQRIVRMVTGALEDAREAAPVSSVASFLFGQF